MIIAVQYIPQGSSPYHLGEAELNRKWTKLLLLKQTSEVNTRMS